MSGIWNPLVVKVELHRAQVGKSLDCEVFLQTVEAFQGVENRLESILGRTRS